MRVDELADKLNKVFACEYCPVTEFCDKKQGEDYEKDY